MVGQPVRAHFAGCPCFRCEPKIGEKNHNWAGGVSDERNELRRELREWSRDVLMRDNFTCVMCHSVGTRLEAHHIKKFSDYPELRLDINNGVTLCIPCHILVTCKEQEYEDMFCSLLNQG